MILLYILGYLIIGFIIASLDVKLSKSNPIIKSGFDFMMTVFGWPVFLIMVLFAFMIMLFEGWIEFLRGDY